MLLLLFGNGSILPIYFQMHTASFNYLALCMNETRASNVSINIIINKILSPENRIFISYYVTSRFISERRKYNNRCNYF